MQTATERLERMKAEVLSKEGNVYPGKSLADFIHKPAFVRSQDRSLNFLMSIHKAQLVMLTKQKILSEDDSAAIKKALLEMPMEDLRSRKYDENCEDMFFATESWMIQHVGECAGNLHLGRSRNDMGSTSCKMGLRLQLLDVMEALNHLCDGLLAFANEHRDTLMIAYTHTQQAQPTTMGHYISGLLYMLSRDFRRLQAAYATVNESPMGAGAITTSGFPLDREIMREMLGFDTLMENAYDCIAAADYVAESACALSVLALDLGRFINNLMVWSAEEYGFLQVQRIYVGISSMMPQKRNPTAFEHLKSYLSAVSGDCNTALVMQHNTTYEDVLDHMDALGHVNRAAKALVTMCNHLYNIMVTMELDKDLLKARAFESFSVMTEFADMLVREEKISYRQAHHVASDLAEVCGKRKLTISQVTGNLIAEVFKNKIGRDLTTSQEIIRQSLDADYFVKVRKIVGGPAPEPMNQMLSHTEQILKDNMNWCAGKRAGLETAEIKLQSALESL